MCLYIKCFTAPVGCPYEKFAWGATNLNFSFHVMIELKAFIRVKIGKIVLKSKMGQLFWDTFF
jgi:hypothetical protein